MANKYATGKKVSQEISIKVKLKEMIKTDSKVYFILWKYAPHLLDNPVNSFADLKKEFKVLESSTITEAFCNNWLMEENVQKAVKWLLNRLHQQKLIELYNIYYDKAKEDTQAFKAFNDFSARFFSDKKESELLAILQNANVDDDEDED